jgi:glucose/mannose-6-phosphate isomerase
VSPDATGAPAAVDPHGVHRVLADLAAQCRRACVLSPSPAPPARRPRLVVVAGMGGSASAGDLLALTAADLDVPVLVHRGYGLPAAAEAGTLVIVSSYSGETEEALSAAEGALARGATMVAVTSGGRLGALARARGVPLVALPGGLMPRFALGYLLLPMLRVLETVGLAVTTPADVAEAVEVLQARGEALGPGRPAPDNEAKALAAALGSRLPAIYGGPLTGGIAYRWKTDLEENAKTLALAGAVPEMNHNTLEAWRAPAAASVHAVLLRDAGERPEIRARFAILEDLLGPVAGGVSEAWTRGEGRLARLLSLVCLGQWVSYYLALARGVDPWPVARLDEVKRRLASS